MARKELWTEEQEYEDYQVARDFLGFTYAPEEALEIVTRMRTAPVVYHYAANILRVAGSPVLGESNVHVVRVLDEYHKGKLLTPALIVRGSGGSRILFILADGYYRIWTLSTIFTKVAAHKAARDFDGLPVQADAILTISTNRGSWAHDPLGSGATDAALCV